MTEGPWNEQQEQIDFLERDDWAETMQAEYDQEWPDYDMPEE